MDDARFMALPSAGRGMTVSIVWHFWSTDFAPLPKGTSSLFALSQGNFPIWMTHREKIAEILVDLAPQFVAARDRRDQKRATLEHLRERRTRNAAIARMQKMNGKRVAKLQAFDLVDLVSAPRPGEKARQAQIPIPPRKPERGFVDRSTRKT